MVRMKLLTLFLCKFQLVVTGGNDVFRQNIGDKMEIGLTEKGYKTVELKCGSDSMSVNLETEEEFSGVIYTRGNFHGKKDPCFYDAEDTSAQTFFKMKIPFDKCNTKEDGNVYSNVLILQHDKELIMPGDAAFNLECDFNKPRDITVTADMHSTSAVASRITLVDADPAKVLQKRDKRGMFESSTNSVVITPDALKHRKEEL